MSKPRPSVMTSMFCGPIGAVYHARSTKILQMKMNRYLKLVTIGCGFAIAATGVDAATGFSNTNGIANTRHNLTQSTMSATLLGASAMDPYRNDYGAICVYCHTPHAANTTTAAPLWNRTINANTYTTYDQGGSTTFTGTISQPGANSRTCLSCHDGTVAIDSIINMPGSAANSYSAASETTNGTDTFLNGWSGGGSTASTHQKLDAALGPTSCLACHSSGGLVPSIPFDTFAIGTDLTNDHPVGVLFPGGVDYNPYSFTQGSMAVFDSDGNGRVSSKDIRLYDTGGGLEVECSSCHDPHGVPSGGAGSEIYPTFLRVSNSGSGVCLTCHNK